MTSKRRHSLEDASWPPSKKRNTSSELDLNYPFWFKGKDPDINPPFIDPEGPLFVNDGQLSLQTTRPIAVINKGVGILTDHSLTVNNQNALSVNIDPEGPLHVSEDGIDLKYNTTLEATDWELGVKIGPEEPIDYNEQGLYLKVDDTLLVEQNELGVHLNPDGPVTADTNGIDLEIDSSLTIVTIHNEKALSVKVKANNPLSKDNDGLFLLYNNNDFNDNGQRGLSLKYPINYLSPYCYIESGNKDLSSSSIKVMTLSQTVWNMQYYMMLTNSSGIVNGMIILRLDRSSITTPGTGPSDNPGLRFTVIINPTGSGYNPSEFPSVSAQPTESLNSSFVPRIMPTETAVVPSNDANQWYERCFTIGSEVTFYPIGDSATQYVASYCCTWPAKAKTDQTPIVVMSFDCRFRSGTGLDWYTEGSQRGLFNSGEIYFNYHGSLPEL